MRRKRTRDERTHLILLVDEQEDMLLSTRRLLEGERHRVLTAASGEHALELMKAEQADLLLVSDMLPGMTVEQFVRAVRAFDPFVQIILRTESSGRKPSPGTMNELDIQGCHDKADGPERLLVWVAAGLRVQQMLSRARECEQQITQRGGDACLRVLLIAPADRDTDATDTLLATHGFQVIRAANPGAAMDAFTRRQPGFAVLDDAFFDQSGTDLVRRIQALDPAVTIIGQCAGLDARQRRAVRRSMGLYALHDKDDQAERLLELLDAAGDSARRQQRTRADSSLRGVILAKLCHDLRSYVHVVHGYVDILSQDEAATRFEPLLSRLASASSAASELVREYLDLAHLEQRAPSMQRELVDVDDYNIPEGKPASYRITPKELEMAAQLIDSMSATFDPDDYHDEFRERVQAIFERLN